ncbi:MAG: fibronectin type III domain-containing protein [Saccharothrix sp.]|nr:fibronectin type III domain-containing protein [Saccharothrix sp.]
MERRKVLGWVGVLVLVTGAVVVLRNESAPPPAREWGRFLDERVEHVADTRPLRRPADLTLAALDRTSLRATWTPTDGLAHGGFEVRWNGRSRLVLATETELTDLDPNAEVTVEVRAVGPLGDRSEPAVAKAVPRLAHDPAWSDPLVQPIDHFDGPESLSPRRWRVVDGGGGDCLGLRPLNGRRLEVTCDTLDLQSNVPLRLGVPGPDGAVGRVVVTTDGPTAADGRVLLALLPEPFQDLGHLTKPYPPGSVVLTLARHGATFDFGEGLVPTTKVVPVVGTSPPPTPGVRHRWELRVLPDAVVALRDGEALATAPLAVPWTIAHPRLAFRGAGGTRVDTFGAGGAPESPVPVSLVPLGTTVVAEERDVPIGTVAPQRLEGATGVRVAARVARQSDNMVGVPITVEFGDRSAPAVALPSAGGPMSAAFVYADFPLPPPGKEVPVRLRAPEPFFVLDARLVVADGQATARRPLPRMTDRAAGAAEVPEPVVTVVHESGPGGEFPRGGKARLVVELDGAAGEVAAVKGVEVDLDGQGVVVLPTNGSAGGRHEFLVDLDRVTTGNHQVKVRVLPLDERGRTRSAEHSFEIRPL